MYTCSAEALLFIQSGTQIADLTAELDESTREVAALKAYIAEAEITATGCRGDVEIPPIPYSLEPARDT